MPEVNASPSAPATGIALAVLTLALGAAPGGAAQAANISTVPTGYTPVTIGDGGVSFYSFDLDANGSNDFTIQGFEGVSISPADPATAALSSFFGSVASSADTSSFTIGSVKSTTGSYTIPSSFGASRYAAAAVNAAFDLNSAGVSGTLGYIQGTATDTGSGRSFTLLDFGLIQPDVTDVPEPASLALLAAGAAGVAALRRRRPAAA